MLHSLDKKERTSPKAGDVPTYSVGLCVFRRFADDESLLLHLVNDGLESVVVVHGEAGKCLAVDFDACLVESTHQL